MGVSNLGRQWSTSITPIQLAVIAPVAVITLDVLRRLVRNRIQRKGYPLPPGPSPLPLIGSVLALNKQEPWLTYTEWREKYGDVVYARLLDSDVVILNSLSDATNLLEKRSQVYSDRPFIATVEPYGLGPIFAFSRYGEHWRLCRRIFHQTFRADAALNFRPMQLRRARRMIENIVDNPNEYSSHFATFSAAVVMSAVYDYEPIPREDPMVSIIDRFLQMVITALSPEKALPIKAFPFLLHIPDWLPGSFIKREAKDVSEWGIRAFETPYKYVEKRMEAREHINPTMVADHITRMKTLDASFRSEYATALKHAASTAFIASAETTTASLMIFTLAMVEIPHIWKRAQAEIDAVVGTDRLPEFDDRPSLPYVEAILRETMRWQPVVPLSTIPKFVVPSLFVEYFAGIPHAATTNDIYKGFYIPKGATVIGNVWAISRDDTRYPDPEKYLPERFLDANGLLTNDNPSDFVFGFGRRICPGRHTADASLWTSIATMLATLDFNLAKDKEGNDIKFKAEYLNGMTHHPATFPCRLTPRPHISKAFLARVLAE